MDPTPSHKRPARLGRGLSSLVGPAPVRVEPGGVASDRADRPTGPHAAERGDARLIEARIDAILPNPNQPRRVFDEGALQALASSIRADGVLQPIVIRKSPVQGGFYELVAGERRLRASKLAGLGTIPAIVRTIDDRGSAELALIENLQRADLNPVERASAFRTLIDRHGMTHGALGDRLGIDRSVVANHLRLLDLDDAVLGMVADGTLGYAHGRALAGVTDPARRLELAQRAIEQGWSARTLEREAARSNEPAAPHADGQANTGTNIEQTRARAVLDDMEKKLSEHLGTRVALKTDRSGTRGQVSIAFFSLDEFDGILDRLGFRGSGM